MYDFVIEKFKIGLPHRHHRIVPRSSHSLEFSSIVIAVALNNGWLTFNSAPSLNIINSADIVTHLQPNLPMKDGRTYNRASIQSYIGRTKPITDLVSPADSSKKMGPNLLPAVQARNAIRALIESGVLEGDDAKRWAEVDDIMTRAKDEKDPDAMVLLGNEYLSGSEGFVLDKKMGYKWYARAASKGSVRGKAHQGWCLFYGEGVKASKMEGAVMLASAAEQGSEFAAYYLGFEFFHGESDGLPKNRERAKYWLRKVVDGGYQGQMDEEDFEEAKKMLKKIGAGHGESLEM